MQEGTYEIRVDVKSGFSARNAESAMAPYTAQTRVQGNSAVVSAMANPLVALYSAPPSPGASMYVQFAKLGPTLSWQNTAPLPIVPGESTNFIVAGMLPTHSISPERSSMTDGPHRSGVRLEACRQT